ncbi:iron(iii) dicitrate-binding protein [hydrocarbon metagenome]|uniref:Iron(Iii) dicitrate-binding protein n=1 Tax=hydrocarbon metagenome TaxID=938273 RepID=A0A0W8G9D3_9ZZZZ
MKCSPPAVALVLACLLGLVSIQANAADTRPVTDALGRTVQVPAKVERLICSGSGCLRLLTYLQAQDLAVAVDDIETRRSGFDARPYALANPQFKTMPLFGEFRGHDNPELIAALSPAPQVILKTYGTMGHDPQALQDKTGLPVVVMDYGDLGKNKAALYATLRMMGDITGKKERAEEVIAFFDKTEADLMGRVKDIPEAGRKTCFVGGIAKKGPHGLLSTEPAYQPFELAGCANVAREAGENLDHAVVAKEKLVVWNPEFLFIDLATAQMGESAGGLYEIKTDPVYDGLSAKASGKVYGLLPYNWYSINFGSILADAYFIGKTVNPAAFADVDPAAKADEIYAFLVGKPVFAQMTGAFGNMAFKPLPLK